jgi:hypothetical protein
VNCPALDEISCQSLSSICRTNYCPACRGAQTFAGCTYQGDPPPQCPMVRCTTPIPCSQVMTRDGCDQRTDCHSVLSDASELCDCSTPDCCVGFIRCADGDKAMCLPPPVACKSVAPYCGPGFALSYTDTCYDGCVVVKDCDQLPPPG